MIRTVLSARGRWRGYVATDEEGMSILQTSTSYKTREEAESALEKGYRILQASRENRMQRTLRRWLGW